MKYSVLHMKFVSQSCGRAAWANGSGHTGGRAAAGSAQAQGPGPQAVGWAMTTAEEFPASLQGQGYSIGHISKTAFGYTEMLDKYDCHIF